MKFTNISVYSFNSVQINDGTNYVARIPSKTPVLANVDIVETERDEYFPAYGGKAIRSHKIPLRIGIMSGGNFETMQNLFDTSTQELKNLVVTDTSTSETYYVKATPISFSGEGAGKVITVILHVPDPIWRKVTADTSTTQCDDSTDVTAANGGSYFCNPVITLKPVTAKLTENLKARFVALYNQSNYSAQNYPWDVFNDTIDHAALVSASQSLATGYDWRVSVDGQEVDRWAGGGGFNSSTLRTWINLDFSPKQEATLGVAINDSDNITTITLKTSTVAARKASLDLARKIIEAENKMVLIDSEVFVCESASVGILIKLTGVTRAQRWTAKAAHTTTDTVRWLEHDIIVSYGNLSATDPEISDDEKPMFNLTTSTNISWVYASYLDRDLPGRPGSWSRSLLRRNPSDLRSNIYTADHNTNVASGAASEMGMRISVTPAEPSYVRGNAGMEWLLECPFRSMKTVTTSGEKYRYLTSWPAICALEIQDGQDWTEKEAYVTPGSADTWTAFGPTATALGGYYGSVRFHFDGGVAAIASNKACVEFDSVTIAKDAAYLPAVSAGSATDTYSINATVTNATTGQAMTLKGEMKLDDELEIDCDNQTIKLNGATNCLAWMKDREGATSSLIPSREWMRLSVGNNTISYTETGAVRVDMTLDWEERSL